jgi:hypothetical protein
MVSWYEFLEDSDELVVDHHWGAAVLGKDRRLDVHSKEPADDLFYRFVCSESRTRLADLIPAEGAAINGWLAMNAGKMSWQESYPSPPNPSKALLRGLAR